MYHDMTGIHAFSVFPHKKDSYKKTNGLVGLSLQVAQYWWDKAFH